ncbi:kanadaptin [Lucilia sericata]|uniref:kanadaptin n=1 Tax=Lucilia sericata TaxID=13632 RepID=UPI0018A882CF|nr:kanadaptin [Lucilia sericata]
MEEFKKPGLPIAPIKVENSKAPAKKPKEIPEKHIESSAGETTKPQVQTQLCPYKIPQWSDKPSIENNYSFEVLKSGQIIDEIKELQNKAFWTFGRLPENDIEMAHPTISRFHAILQYRPKSKPAENLNHDEEGYMDKSENNVEDKSPPEGWYIYDLGSTHGTFLNKQRVPAKVYIRVRVGHMLRLGASTRSYILQGPSEDEEPESELSITEIKAKRQQELEQAALEKKRLADEAIERANNEGCSWGMGEDADEETDLTHNPYASSNNEELFLDDPKKTLRGYFEREGLELVYKCDEMSAGSFVCRVELPIDDANGRPIVAEVVHKGKKKDCVVQCALEACRHLDRHGVLRQANQEPLKRKQKSQDSGSDDDEFWDRTGDVARKKQRKANANISVTLTYEDLLKQENEIEEQTKQIESKIQEYQAQQQRLKAKELEDGEDLDAFMKNLQGNEMQLDKTEIRKLRLEEQRLKSEKQRVQRLIKIAKPIDLPFGKPSSDDKQSEANEKSTIKKQLPMIGKRNQFSKFKIVKVESTSIKSKPSNPAKFLDSDEEETEDVDEPVENIFKESNFINGDVLDKVKVPTNESNCNTAEDAKEITSKITNHEEVKDIALAVPVNENEAEKTLKSASDYKGNEIKEQNVESSQHMPETVECNSTESGNSSKKRRHRIRQRGKRQEVDMMEDDVEYESSDKYAKWVPPENQTGDGFTELNKKFGY